MVQDPAVDLPEQSVVSVKPVEIAIEDQLHPVAMALLCAHHGLDFIKGEGIAVKTTDDVQHILRNMRRLSAKRLWRVAVCQRAAAPFCISMIRPPLRSGQAPSAATGFPAKRFNSKGRKKHTVQIRKP